MRAAVPRPELQLLLSCARTVVDAEQAQRIRALIRKDLDWALLFQSACRHGLAPLLYQGLRATCPDLILAPLRDQFQTESDKQTYHGLLYTAELRTISRQLAAQGIPCLSLKGPLLATRVYGNVGLRKFWDLDLFVDKDNVLKAKELLVSVGYQPEYQLPAEREVRLLECHDQYGLVRRQEGKPSITVELHWATDRVPWAACFDTPSVWTRAERICIDGQTVFTLSAQDLLIYLCEHGTKHLWGSLKWLCDIAQLLRAEPDLDWAWIVETAQATGRLRMLSSGLLLAHTLFDANLPQVVWQQIDADPQVQVLEKQIRSGIFQEDSTPAGFLQEIRFYWQIRERFRERIAYSFSVLKFCFRPNLHDWLWFPLPAPLSFFYNLTRPVRLLIQAGTGCWVRLTQNRSAG